MSKFLLNLLVQFSKALVYSKIKFYSENNFPVTSGPSGLFGPATAHSLFFQPANFPSPPPLGLGLLAGPTHPHGPTGHLLPPPALAPPDGLTPPPGSTPTPPPEEKKMAASIPFIPPLLDAVSPSSIIDNRRLQRRPLKLLQRRPLKMLGLASAL
jgi:hypothetical protein